MAGQLVPGTMTLAPLALHPEITQPPSLFARRTTLLVPDAHVCGWVTENPYNAFTCGAAKTCMFNSATTLAACAYDPASIVYTTSCVAFAKMSDCDSACLLNSNVIKCKSDLPNCITASWFFSDHHYTMYVCETASTFTGYGVSLTYANFATPIPLPIMVDNAGNLQRNTIQPPSTAVNTGIANTPASPSATGSASAASAAAAEASTASGSGNGSAGGNNSSSNGNSTGINGSNGNGNGNSSNNTPGQPTPASDAATPTSEGGGVNVGAIVGGVVAAVFLICVAAVLIALMLRRRARTPWVPPAADGISVSRESGGGKPELDASLQSPGSAHRASEVDGSRGPMTAPVSANLGMRPQQQQQQQLAVHEMPDPSTIEGGLL